MIVTGQYPAYLISTDVAMGLLLKQWSRWGGHRPTLPPQGLLCLLPCPCPCHHPQFTGCSRNAVEQWSQGQQGLPKGRWRSS